MSAENAAILLDWAAAEGWNPGLDDLKPFLAADPDGFFLEHIDGMPAAGISLVNHNRDFAFLGLYIAAPAFRGLGHGLAV